MWVNDRRRLFFIFLIKVNSNIALNYQRENFCLLLKSVVYAAIIHMMLIKKNCFE